MSSRFRIVRLSSILLLIACLTPRLGFSGEVTIYRDASGVPHIYGENEADGFYGLGYAQAYTAHAYEQSYLAASPHYNDQIELFSDKQLKRVYFDRESVEKHAASKLVLQREHQVGK